MTLPLACERGRWWLWTLVPVYAGQSSPSPEPTIIASGSEHFSFPVYSVPAMRLANAPLTSPLSCILNGCRLLKRQAKRDSSRSRDRLKVPPTRKCCPSSPLPDDEYPTVSRETQNTKMEQSRSMFMTRLPLEVRTMIYEEVLCRPVGVVHITTRKDGKLVYFRCKAEDGRCRGFECFHGNNEDLYSTWRTRDKDLFSTWSPSNTPDRADGGLVALLQSCRQVSVSLNMCNTI